MSCEQIETWFLCNSVVAGATQNTSVPMWDSELHKTHDDAASRVHHLWWQQQCHTCNYLWRHYLRWTVGLQCHKEFVCISISVIRWDDFILGSRCLSTWKSCECSVTWINRADSRQRVYTLKHQENKRRRSWTGDLTLEIKFSPALHGRKQQRTALL